MRKVEISRQRLGNRFMSGKLSAIIRGDRMHAIRQRLEHVNDCLFDRCFRVAFDFRQSRQLRLPPDQRHDGLLVVLADDRVGFLTLKQQLDEGGKLILYDLQAGASFVIRQCNREPRSSAVKP
jgi:hypothetical protein